jgi:2-desacetyl-2-hydroxyethyl bacteriochlorophyllide A dehydrogenase
MGDTMRAQFYRGAGRFEAETVPVPARGPGETLLRVRRVGICGTDLHIFQGHLDQRVPKGGVIGHETVAEVVQAEPGSAFRAGDRVVVNPVLSCGRCRACRMGASYICYALRILGVDADGALREYFPAPTDRLLAVPATLGDEEAALLEPLSVAVHDVNRAAVKTGDAVLVLGGGPIGTLIALVCRHRGARVIVSEVNPHRLEMLGRLGLDTAGPGEDVVRLADERTGGEGMDVAFEVSGNPAAARVMVDVVRVWGTVSVVAIHGEPVPVDLYRMFAREVTVHGSRLYTPAAWEEAIRLAAAGAVPLAPLVSRVVPLGALQAGMEAALGGGPVMKVLVDVTR